MLSTLVKIDTREVALGTLLPNCPKQQLPVGDIWIMANAPGGLVIERKTTLDLEASLFDGRYREQRTRLLSYCHEHDLRPMYILEGDITVPTRTITPSALQKIVHRLMLRHGIAVWCTISVQSTAATVLLLEAQLQADPATFARSSAVAYTDVIPVTRRGNRSQPGNFAVAVLRQCPGISNRIAVAILAVFGTLETLMVQQQSTLQAVPVGERTLGPVVAKRLYGLLHASVTDE